MKHILLRILSNLSAGAVVGILLTSSVEAGERRFVYSYEAQSYVPGSVELENWITWKTDDDFNRFDFRHELEFGITEKLQLGIYMADWRYQDGDKAAFHDAAVEVIYNLMNPYEDPFGFSIYGEVKFAEEFLELESKILLQKNIGSLAFIYNLTVESEWEENGLTEVKGEIGNSLGVSYLVNPKWGVGAELLHEVEIADWNDAGKSVVYLGPNATFRSGPLWVTTAGLWEVSNTDEPEFQLRMITGWHF